MEGKREAHNTTQAEPRKSSRLARKRVMMGTEGWTDDPEHLPYYMEAVEQGNAGKWYNSPSMDWRTGRSLSRRIRSSPAPW